MSSNTASRGRTAAPQGALPDAYAAAMHIYSLLRSEGHPLSPAEQRAALNAWTSDYLTRCHAPLEPVQDCTQWLQSTVANPGGATRGLEATAPSQTSSVSTILVRNPFQRRPAEQAEVEEASSPRYTTSSSSSSSSSNSERDDANGAAAIPVNPTLDVDYCTIARMLQDEDQQWLSLHETANSPTAAESSAAAPQSPPEDVFDDVFSVAAMEREAWQCWAAVLREVKVEAAAQQMERRGQWDGTQVALNRLLKYLRAPETSCLLEDSKSSVLMAADMYMLNRDYAGGKDGLEVQEMYGDRQVDRGGTHDMQAVHDFLLQQDPEEPPLRSLIHLALASHIGNEN